MVVKVAPSLSTYAQIEKKVRRLTASSSSSVLTSNDIGEYVNTYYMNDFPYGIKIDQMRSVYTFFTEPYRDRYPIDVNFNQGLRDPVYFEGIRGSFFKDRRQFFNVWPKFPTKFTPPLTTTGTITNIVQPSNPAQIVTNTAGLITGETITISNVGGMTELNGNSYVITVVSSTLLTLNGVDNTAFGAYTGGGTFTANVLSFNIPGPFLSKEVVLGGVDINGNPISINDDGNGNLLYQVPNPVATVPPYTDVYSAQFPVGNAPDAGSVGKPIPGMHNQNTLNPGLNNTSTVTAPFTIGIGTVNYVTGDFSINFPVPPEAGSELTLWVSQYQTGRPYNLLFWNNELTIRPVPKLIHKVEVESYLTPVQFMESTDSPILNQWWQLIAIGAAIKVLEDRQDMDGVENLVNLYSRQEDLCLERQAVEELFQPNFTLFNTSTPSFGGVNGIGYY